MTPAEIVNEITECIRLLSIDGVDTKNVVKYMLQELLREIEEGKR